MVAQALAIALWVGSLALYGAAFFFPEVHRRHDFLGSGVAAFYGLVLWFDAVQISPTELLGHGASVGLLGWFGWQTLSLRRKRTPLNLQTPLTAESWPQFWEKLRRSVGGWAKASPVGRWLPEAWQPSEAIDPALAVSTIRVSSLKDVDYEFVDALAPADEPRAIAAPPAVPAPGPAAPPAAVPAPPAPVPKPPRQIQWAALPARWSKRLSRKSVPANRDAIDTPPRPSPSDRSAPPRQLIDIPPRPSALKRQPPKPDASKPEAPKREVIDIPPRPSRLRNRAQPPAADSQSPDTVTIVDAAASNSGRDATGQEPPLVPDNDSRAHSSGIPSMNPRADATDGPTPAADSPAPAQDDEDTNWIDD